MSHGIGRRTVMVVAAVGLALGPLIAAPAAGAAPFNPTISLSTTTGRPGTRVTITGSGFPPQALVALYIDQPSPYLGAPGPLADAKGTFTMDLVWPDQKYDKVGKVNPATPGVHSVCGDTSYSGSTQQYAAKACAQFVVNAVPSSPTTQSPAPVGSNSSGPGLAWVIGSAAILIALAIGALVFMRRSG